MRQCTCGAGWTDDYCPIHGSWGGQRIQGPDSPTARHHTQQLREELSAAHNTILGLRAENKEMANALKAKIEELEISVEVSNIKNAAIEAEFTKRTAQLRGMVTIARSEAKEARDALAFIKH